jgi:hypothetical protein
MKPDKPPAGQSGFAVPLTLILIGVLSLSLWGALHVLEGLNRDLENARARQALQIAGASADSRIGFLLLSEPLEPRGIAIGEERIEPFAQLMSPGDSVPLPQGLSDPDRKLLWADGRDYQFGDENTGKTLLVRLQDEAGLFSWSFSPSRETEQMLALLLEDDEITRNLAAALADFVDEDDLIRLNGAERDDYRRAGLPPPRNAALEQPSELWWVLGWKPAFGPEQRRELLRVSSTALLQNAQNVNTAPTAVLRSWFGLSQSEAESVTGLRQQQPLSGPRAITALTGVPLEFEPTRSYAFPSRRFHVSVLLETAGGRWLERTSMLTLAEPGADRPLYLNSEKLRILEPQDPELTASLKDEAAEFPSGKYLSAD